MGKEFYLTRLKDVALNGEKAWTQNNMFEFNVMMEWLAWRPPAKVCVSWEGIFSECSSACRRAQSQRASRPPSPWRPS
jgi:hypothetical protein